MQGYFFGLITKPTIDSHAQFPIKNRYRTNLITNSLSTHPKTSLAWPHLEQSLGAAPAEQYTNAMGENC
jgi:hypothetical protein